MSDDRAAVLRGRYVTEMVSGGFVHTGPWVDAFRSVPRDVFLPRFFRQTDTGLWEAIDEQRPERLALVYTNCRPSPRLGSRRPGLAE